MEINILKFDDYKSYLSEKITLLAKADRSLRANFSKFVNCQQSYLSQVLYGKPDFTLEQAIKINQFFHHSKIEAKYFILLIEKSRAGTHELRKYFEDEIKELKKDQFNLKKQLKETEEVDEKAQHIYYSAWFYSAIYVALSIPKMQGLQTLAKHFNLPEELVSEVLQFLQTSGLIELKNGKYQITKKRLHLERESTFIQRHHINWRSQALQSVEKNLPTDMHFSTVVALSKSDIDEIRKIFLASIEKAREVIRPSPEEELIAITLDVFKL